MIGEDQAKGYPDEAPILDEKIKEDTFEDRKKRALQSIGMTEDQEQVAQTPEDRELLARQAMMNKNASLDHKIQVMQQDLMVLRKQMNAAVDVLNKLQLGFISKLSEMQGRIDSKLEDLKKSIKVK